MSIDKHRIRSIKPRKIADSMIEFDRGHVVTKGEFSITVPGLLADMEWNHMDQQHRPFIHNTYQANLRIALGRDFAVSLTRFGRWPFLITVTDSRIEEGVYYQEFVLAGFIFVHNTISMQETNELVDLKIEWAILSSRWLKFVHGLLSRKFYQLNTRLQVEDAAIRSQRYALRKQGYSFLSDPPDFYSSNLLTNNTVYPPLQDNSSILLTDIPMQVMTKRAAGGVEFLVYRESDAIKVWPATCPHEGGVLEKGKLHDHCRLECPWHGLKFNAAHLSSSSTEAAAYGFQYTLSNDVIQIHRNSSSSSQC